MDWDGNKCLKRQVSFRRPVIMAFYLEFVPSLNCLEDLLFSLIQSCDERNSNEAVMEQHEKEMTARRFKPSELAQSAQKLAR